MVKMVTVSLDFFIKNKLFSELFNAPCLNNVWVTAMGGWGEGCWILGDFGLSEDFVNDFTFLEEVATLRGQLEEYNGWPEGNDEVVWHDKKGVTFR